MSVRRPGRRGQPAHRACAPKHIAIKNREPGWTPWALSVLRKRSAARESISIFRVGPTAKWPRS